MTNEIYGYKLKLPFEFNPCVQKDTCTAKIVELPENVAFEEFLNNLNLTYYKNERFYLSPYSILPIHADADSLNDYTKLNFVIGGRNSIIKWYNPKPNTSPVVHELVHKVSSGKLSLNYLKPKSINDIDEVFSLAGDGVTLFNSGHYHGVVNGPEERVTYSFMLRDLSTGRHVNWADAVEKFKEFIV